MRVSYTLDRARVAPPRVGLVVVVVVVVVVVTSSIDRLE